MNLLNLFSGKPEDKILSVKYKKPIDEQLIDKLIYFIQSSGKKSSKVITEINSSINSLVAGVLFKKAFGEKAIALIFDFDSPKTNTLIELCKSLGLNTYILKRGSAYQKELAQYHFHQKDINNFYIRFVNYHLSIQAEIEKAEIADTTDKSDRLTIQQPNLFYGAFMPFYSLYKSEVYDLARLLNINKTPTDFDYWTKIDPVLFLLTEKQLTPEEISQQYSIDLHFLKRLKAHIDKQLLKTTVSQFII